MNITLIPQTKFDRIGLSAERHDSTCVLTSCYIKRSSNCIASIRTIIIPPKKSKRNYLLGVELDFEFDGSFCLTRAAVDSGSGKGCGTANADQCAKFGGDRRPESGETGSERE